MSYDVIIVGAGLAGIRAAEILQKQGYNVKILEANNVSSVNRDPFKLCKARWRKNNGHGVEWLPVGFRYKLMVFR